MAGAAGGGARRNRTPDDDRTLLGAVAALALSALARLAHHDGPGCLADLDALAAQVPDLAESYAVVRAQCTMEAGRCAEGKAMAAAWYVRYGGMSEEGARQVATNLAALHCRGGDASPAERLRTAFFDLSRAAYLDPRGPAHCESLLALIDDLLPRLAEAEREDPAIEGGAAALFHTGAACFARAGACDRARAVYRARFPRPDGVPADVLDRQIETSFEASFPDCRGGARRDQK